MVFVNERMIYMNTPKRDKNVKSIAATSVFWIVLAALVVGFILYGNAKYQSGVTAGYEQAKTLIDMTQK